MISVESDNIREEYEVLLNELKQYNPELLDKSRILAVTKCDLLDAEMLRDLRKDLPEIQTVFISSVAETGLDKMKRMLWNELQ